MSSFEDIVDRFTNRSIPVPREGVERSIAAILHKRVNNACRRAEWSHYRMRKHKAQVHNLKFGGKSPRDDHHYIDQAIYHDNIKSHQFDVSKWCNTIRVHARERIAQFRNTHAALLNATQSTRISATGDAELEFADGFFEDDAFSDGWSASTKAETELTELLDISDIATEVSEAASIAELELAAEAASLVALGEIAIIVLPLLLPVLISLFFSSTSGFEQELARADAEHERLAQELQRKIRENQEILDAYDKHTHDLNKKDQERWRKRKDDKKRKDDEEQEQKKRQDSYYACVDRIMPLDFSPSHPYKPLNGEASISQEPLAYGYELRMSAIRKDGYWNTTFLGIIQEHELGVDAMAFLGIKIHVITMYLHSLPNGVDVGSWVEFELDRKFTKSSNHQFIVKDDTFVNGVASHEVFVPYGFTDDVSPRFIADSSWGMNTRVNLDTFKLAPENVLTVLNHGINAFNPISNAVHHGSRRLVRFQSPETSINTSINLSANVAANSDPQAQFLYTINCGQGSTQFLLNNNLEPVFAIDCGYGRGTQAIMDNLRAVLETAPECPMVLSHWDKDHYGLATSQVAGQIGYRPEKRRWLAPNFVTGSLALQLYNQLDRAGNLYTLNKQNGIAKTGNINIHVCEHVQGTSHGKNNDRALAVSFGSSESGYGVYPGDANYECIPGIDELDSKVVIMVATHHGSQRSITNGKNVGTFIPKAMPKAEAYHYEGDPQAGRHEGSVCLFSYGEGNSYGHDSSRVAQYYKGLAQYSTLETTVGKEGEGTQWHGGILVGLANGFSGQIQPEGGSNTEKNTVTNTEEYALPERPGAFRVPPSCSSFIELHSGFDAMDKFAIRDSHGSIVEYRVVAQTISISAPLQIHCKADFSIPVVIQCMNVEINLPSNFSEQNASPLIEFDVANGDAWNAPADYLAQGENGNDAYQGGYLDLRVWQNWKIRKGDTLLFDSASTDKSFAGSIPLVIKYCNGRGGDGQEGGRGRKGTDGRNGTDDKDSSIKGKPAFPGAAGGVGRKGGDAGGPGLFLPSKLTGLKGKLEANNNNIVIYASLDTNGFGAAGNPGRGGKGGPGGMGGIEGVRIVNGEIVSKNRRMANGHKGPKGDAGEPWKGVMPDYTSLAPRLEVHDEEQEMSAAFFSVIQ
ncbi:hypothetical protein GGR51DRAFT_578166 [Nemania sp. FL0031]|nr:hypothetical protein GGR51DRAFT_578166 [Nemania sp. FL0031]